MSLNDKLLKAAATAGGITPSEHFGVMLYEGDDKAGHSINGGKFGAGAAFGIEKSSNQATDSRITTTYYAKNVGSISGWLKKNGNTSELEYVFVTKDDTGSAHQLGINLLQEADSDLSARVGNGSSTTNVNTSGLTLNNDAWHHFVVTWNLPNSSNNVKVYVNGSLSSTGSQTTGSWTGNSSRTFQLGHYTNTSNNGFAGMLDQVRVFEKELSSSEVSTLYAETAATVESLDPLNVDTTDTLQVLGDTSCIATYRFENNEDDKSGNYNGTGNSIQYAAGRYGQSASFNGTDSVVTGTAQNVGSSFSISAWIYPASYGEHNVFNLWESSSDLFQFGLDDLTNQKLSIAAKSSNTWYVYRTTASPIVSLNQWYHIVVNRSSSDLKIYVNGTFLESANNFYAKTYNTFNIGAGKSTSTNSFFDGKIDQVRVFNKTLSASEVTTLYNENPLVASYRFEGNSNDDMRTYNGTDNDITYEFGLNFTPDFVWIKPRNQTENHTVHDSTRGSTNQLATNSSTAAREQGNTIQSFDSGGFTTGSDNNTNKSGINYVAWCFKANGGTTSSNTDGTITSTVQANTDSGFSIIKYTGTGSNASIGHNLGVAPEIIFIKKTSGSSDWVVGALEWTKYLELNGNPAFRTANVWQDTAPTSSVFTLTSGGDVNGSGSDYIAYAFASIDGFSKIGTYTGTGETKSIETGFEPAFLLSKRTSSTSDWYIIDNKRNTTNPRNNFIDANNTGAEYNPSYGVNFNSNGFSLISTDLNGTGQEWMYMAFAADPDTEAPTLAKSFSTVTYTGNSTSNRTIDTGFDANFIWIKKRNATESHVLVDSLRPGSELYSNATNAQSYYSDNPKYEKGSNGFIVGNTGGANGSGNNYVAWSWKADDNEPTIFGGPAIAVYKFEDNANDVSGTYNGTASNISYSSSGQFNKAAEFNGSNSGINIGNIGIGGAAARTISAWVYVDNLDSAQTIFQYGSNSNGQRFGFAIDTAGKVYVEFYNRDAITSSAQISANTWYHLVATYNGGAIEGVSNTQIYVDGVAVAMSNSGAQTGSANTGNSNYGIGYDRLNTRQYFDGKIDQLRIYRGVISDVGVAELYAETVSDNDDLEIGGPPEIIVSANANAGFSIVKYTGTYPTHQKIPHGLSAVPEMIIIKNLADSADWEVYHSATGNTGNLVLNSSAAFASNSGFMANTSPTATVFTVGNDGYVNGADDGHIAYCFHSVSGYSKFGSYTGTGNSGHAINVGFQPDFVVLKSTTSSENWSIFDSVRGGDIRLFANTNVADESNTDFAFSSTGFVLPQWGSLNGSGQTFIYMAFKAN